MSYLSVQLSVSVQPCDHVSELLLIGICSREKKIVQRSSISPHFVSDPTLQDFGLVPPHIISILISIFDEAMSSQQPYQPLGTSPSSSSPSPVSSSQFRRWRPFLLLLSLAGIISLLLPYHPYSSLSEAAKGLVHSSTLRGEEPTIAVVDTRDLVNLMAKVSLNFYLDAQRATGDDGA